MFNGIEHTAIASADPEGLAGWYRDTLGFVINHVHDGNYFVRARDGSMLEIIKASHASTPVQRADPGIRHLAIEVGDFDAALEHLRTCGVTFLSEPIDSSGNRLVFFADRDGNILHLIRRLRPLP